MLPSSGEEPRCAASWDRFWQVAAEVQANIARREQVIGQLERMGHAQKDFDEVDRAFREFERDMRRLRSAAQALPGLVSEAGCDAELEELRRNLNRLSKSWRDLKSTWRHRIPRRASGD
ncbi:hypothetical protein SFC79_17070 [Nocardioides sp. S-58]|uniref:Uncharacterized protein n=1 Tax=Nocardioides renjunii TaxID=3095075 RepID=A0ABU5KF87_9ACTN|nr:hypothetical protein [Nocardioides sp. S-58]MDZ5663488.1 hypothetical protein [Nocardioides sp. S-58]